jgi:hypothetical protein
VAGGVMNFIHPHNAEPDPADAGQFGGTGKGSKAGAAASPATKLRRRQIDPVGAARIPPRQWAYGKFLLFGCASVIGAVDGGGKGAITVGIILSMITGEPIFGERVWRTGPVAIITYEDDVEEWHRRIAAACEFYRGKFNLNYEHVIENLHFIEGTQDRISFATKRPSDGAIISDTDEISDLMTEIGAVLLVVDPFNHAHALDDGNNNVLIAKVASEMARVAEQTNAAVLVLHHLRKGANGAADDLLGAVALRATFRSCIILAKMEPIVAKDMKLEDHWRYIRITGSKENYAPPPEDSTWFKLESVSLENGTEAYPAGDNMAVATIFTMRSTFEGLDYEKLSMIFDNMNSTVYSPKPQASNWLGDMLMTVGGRSKTEAKTIITKWTDSGTISTSEYTTENKNKATKVTLNAQKAAEILTGLSPQFNRAD